MKLAKLELSGFKSFADYTEFVFDDGVTGIVGPNGCGKSNVVDAVKWVLGEMSAKSLRGDAMLDVIFNGSSSRKPMGMAEVSLNFTNEDRRLPIEADAVKITRRLYRDATSEYLINGKMARLKDIRELFLDTGVGVDAYSVIEQGHVMSLVEQNASDRREVFEEAAGISRFKQRKKEALRKLEKTDQNLAQSALVVEEVQKQLRSVKVQAGRARSYQEYAQRLRELRSAYVLREYGQLHIKHRALADELDTVVDELAVVRRELEGRRNRQQELQLELEAAQEAARQAERTLLTARSEQKQARQQGQFAQQQITQLSQQRQLLTDRQADLTGRRDARQQEAAALEGEFAAIDQKLKTHETQVAAAVTRQEQAAKAIALLNRQMDEQKTRGIDLMRQAARFHNDINTLQIQQENLQHQKQRLEERKTLIDQQVAELKTKAQELGQQKEELTAAGTALQEQAEAVRQEQRAVSENVAQISQELARQREQRSALKSRHSVLMDLQAKREGVNQTVRDVLKARDAGKGFGYVQAIVADLISADLEHAAAIEAALGELANTLVIDDSAALLADAGTWQKLSGRVTTLARDRLLAWQDDGALGRVHQAGRPLQRASDLVNSAPEDALLARQILGRTIITDTLANALALAQELPRDYRFVTRAGEVVEPATSGQLVLGDMTKRTGMISRRAEVAKLESELADLEKVIVELTAQIAAGEAQNRELDARLQELRQKRFQTDSERAQVSAQWQQTTNTLQKTSSEGPLIAGEIESLDRQMQAAGERRSEYQVKVAAVEEQQQAAEKVVHELGAQIIVRQHEVTELAEAATQARVAMGQVQEQRSSLSRALATARQARQQAELELQRIGDDLAQLAGRLSDAEAMVAKTDEQVAGFETQAAEAEARLSGHAETVSTLRSEAAELTAGLTSRAEQAEALGRREHDLSLRKNELGVRIETLIEHTQEELQINLVEALATHEPEDMDWEQVAAEINELKGKISRLGNVNIDAINEQQALEDRQAFLEQQLADIADAKRQLEELITKINDDSRVRFAETFAAVRIEFQDMFRKLFGGGKADLILENPDDVLESGIEILAKPPGKELQSITLLSGGEKTMTAVALVMSIFKSKPSPFCILDEVDAALDETNTARFAAIIHEFLATSQFIVITHNKRTMSVASMLYGVTMQEQGISKRVAVKFDGRGAAQVTAEKSSAAA